MRTPLKPLVAGLCLLALNPHLHAQGTAFTYQGQLTAGGNPANGSFDLRFAIFDSAEAMNQIGNALTNPATPVTAGHFTVTLDFGTGVFTGGARWLEVGVRSNATGNFTTLSPLQLLTPAPYAIAAGSLLGTLPASQLPSTVVTNNQANLNLSGNLSGNISGNGSGLTNTPGTVIWRAASGASFQAQSNTGYLLTNAQQVTLTLPASPNIGDVVKVAGVGSGGWVLAQNPGQSISGSFTPLWAGIGAPTNNDWESLASSSDGTKLAAAVYGGGIYTSTNSGSNWTQQIRAPGGYWQAVASSSDGTKLAAVVYGGGIYTSTDSGTNWTPQTSAPNGDWEALASSSDGTKLAAVVYYGGGIYTSTDSGVTWTQQTNAPNEYWDAIASSSDGTKLAAAIYSENSGIYTSVNSGTNWTPQTRAPNEYWEALASSSDGTKLAAVAEDANIYTSVNSGTNWTQQTSAPDEHWDSIASSSDGTKLAAVVYGGGIYTSTDSGTNWTQQAGGPGPSSTATTIGTTGFLAGMGGTTIELIYTGGGRFVALSQLGTVYDH
jgi:hypothetical protein